MTLASAYYCQDTAVAKCRSIWKQQNIQQYLPCHAICHASPQCEKSTLPVQHSRCSRTIDYNTQQYSNSSATTKGRLLKTNHHPCLLLRRRTFHPPWLSWRTFFITIHASHRQLVWKCFVFQCMVWFNQSSSHKTAHYCTLDHRMYVQYQGWWLGWRYDNSHFLRHVSLLP